MIHITLTTFMLMITVAMATPMVAKVKLEDSVDQLVVVAVVAVVAVAAVVVAVAECHLDATIAVLVQAT